MSSSVHIDNKGKDILIIVEGPTQRLYDTALTAEKKFPINFRQSGKRFVLGLYRNGSNSFLFVNATKLYQFKAKDSKIKYYALVLGNIRKLFIIIIIFFFDFNPIDTNDIIDIHRYLMKRTKNKKMFRLNKEMFMRLLISIVNATNHTKCVLLSNQKYMTQPTLINLRPNEYSQEFYYYHLRLN